MKESKQKKSIKYLLRERFKQSFIKYLLVIGIGITIILLGILIFAIATAKKKQIGSIAEWVSAILSAAAIYAVYWQVNREINNEKELRKEYSRPFFSINIIFNFKDNIRTYIPNNGDIDVLRRIDKKHIKMRGKNLYYCSTRGASQIVLDNKLDYKSE